MDNADTKITTLRRKNVLVVGKSQVGKSHLCNVISGKPGLFREGNRVTSCTLEPQMETFQFLADDILYEVTLADTMGMFDSRTKQDNDKLMGGITEFIRYSIDSVHRIFYVVKLGVPSPEELSCLQLFRTLLSDEALQAGICSMVVTFCDNIPAAERTTMVSDLCQTSRFAPFIDMFAGGSRGTTPEVLPVDFSPNSQTWAQDRAAVVQSIGRTNMPMHKTKLFRLFATMQEAQERQKMRAALIANIKAELKKEDPYGSAICPQQ